MSAKDTATAAEASAPEPLTDIELEEAAGGYGQRSYYSYTSERTKSYSTGSAGAARD